MAKSSFLVILFCIATVCLLAGEGKVPIYQQTTITQPGHYIVTRDISIASGSVLTIQADEVQVDLGGFTLSTSSSSAAVMEISSGKTDLFFYNGRLKGGMFGIHHMGSSSSIRVSVKDVEIIDPVTSGISMTRVNKADIDHCRIVRSSPDIMALYGILLQGDPGSLECRVTDNVVEGTGFYGIYLDDVTASEIRGNEVTRYAQTDSSYSGIFIIGPSIWQSGGSRIVGNRVRNDGINGVGISVTANATISGNLSIYNGKMGIRCSQGCLIENNTVSFNGTYGIEINGPYNVIRGNNITGNGTTTSHHGISCVSGENLVEDNSVQGNAGYGLYLSPIVFYRDNILRGNGAGAVFSGYDAGGNII
ncbi:MAG TPA: right-handed parallel beta-helix repeat-containing protein [Thermoanaerobaculia bacterium]|nr:right-handed parallel beta-helix repeat-containing protein [Thermoanaerobaculia bacterium]HUM29654.1 right-handed parallel beta-helix repeat-containing protein [Thermoanaerobaculia bacterium]HXK67305.1 right-handed parallel beta-helix repeat-containing protein [Thermoanaerobaculia bacterium]